MSEKEESGVDWNPEWKGTPENSPSCSASETNLQKVVGDSEGPRDSATSHRVDPLPGVLECGYSSESQGSEEKAATIRRRKRKKIAGEDEHNVIYSFSDKACSFISALFRLKSPASFYGEDNSVDCKPTQPSEKPKCSETEKQILFERVVEALFPPCVKDVWTQVYAKGSSEDVFGSSLDSLPKNAEELWKWTPVKLLTTAVREWQLSFLKHLRDDISGFPSTPLPHGRYYRFKWLKDDSFLLNIDCEESMKCIREHLYHYRTRSIFYLCGQTSIEDMLLRDGYLLQDESIAATFNPVLKEAVKEDVFDGSTNLQAIQSRSSSERLNPLPESSQVVATKQDSFGELKHNHRKGTSCPACHARTSAKHRAKDATELSWKGSASFVLKWLDSVASKQCDVCSHGINEGLDDISSPGLVFASCIICGVTVHALCYGVLEVEDILLSSMKGTKRFFLCSPCSEESFMASCVICSRHGGALKKTEDGHFAHLYCALWTPKVFVKDIQRMEPIVNLESAKSTAPGATCIFCLKENTGITVSCAFPDCSQCFHVYCAREAGQKPHIVLGAEGKYRFVIFCSSHKLSAPHLSASKDNISAVLNTLQPRILKRSKKASLSVEDRDHDYTLNPSKRRDPGLYERNETGMIEAHLRLKKRDWNAATLFKLHNVGKPQLLNFEVISPQQTGKCLLNFVYPDKNRNNDKACHDEIWETTQRTFEEERNLVARNQSLIEKMFNTLTEAYNRESVLKTELKMEKKILLSLKGIQKLRKTVDASRPTCLRNGGVVSVSTAQKHLRELLQDSAAMKEAKEDVSTVESTSHRRRTQVIRNAAAKNSSSSTPIRLKPVFKEEDNFEDFSTDLPQELTACCSVCGSGDCDEVGNDIILCDGCHVAVHQTCYGVQSIPEGDWFCSSCVAVGRTIKNDMEVATSLGYRYPRTHELVADPYRCILCPMVGGALKPTNVAGKWGHVSCAMWLPETYFENPETMEPIMGFDKVIAERWNLKCSVCNQRNVGPCIQCTLRHCGRAFHVSCGLTAGLHMCIKEDSSKGAGVSLVALCPKHSRAHFSATEHSRIISLRKRRRSSPASMNGMDQGQKPSHSNLHNNEDPVYTHVSDEGKKHDGGNTSNFSALESGDDIWLHLKRLKKLHHNLEEARTLCDLVRKREHLKRGLILIASKVYNQQFLENFGNQLSDEMTEDAEVRHGKKNRQKPLKLRLRGGGDSHLCEHTDVYLRNDDEIAETTALPRGNRSSVVGAVAASAAAAVRAAGAAFRFHRGE